MFLASKSTPRLMRAVVNGWEDGSAPVKWDRFRNLIGRRGVKKLEKAGTKSREIRAWIVEVKDLIEECEARIGEADQNWVIEERSKRPLATKQGRWMEGRRGWTGVMTPEDIVEPPVAELHGPDTDTEESSEDTADFGKNKCYWRD